MAEYKITVLDVGYDVSFPLGVAFDFWYKETERAFSPFCMTLVQGGGHNILYDCGILPNEEFSKKKIELENDQKCHSPKEVLNSIGMTPDDIDIIILSHCHWDHIGGLSEFQSADVYIQKEEVAKWKEAIKNQHFPMTIKQVVNPHDFQVIEAFEKEGRLHYLKGDTDNLIDGIDVKEAKGHSYSQNMLFINSNGKHYALVGDVAMRPENFKGSEMFNCFLPNLKFAVGTVDEIVRSYKIIMDWTDNNIDSIIMTHDGTRKERFPTKQTLLGLNVSVITEK